MAFELNTSPVSNYPQANYKHFPKASKILKNSHGLLKKNLIETRPLIILPDPRKARV